MGTQHEDNVEKLNRLIAKMSDPRKTLVRKMMDGLIGEEFVLAPASAKEEYHSCYPGGLLQHSLNVTMNLKLISDKLCPGKFSEDTIIFVGLFHDLGKVGDGLQVYYEPHPVEWHRKQGTLYQINKDCIYMPTSERGLYILQNQGITVSPDEYLAIRLNDGQYDDTNKSYRMREPELALLCHWADLWSTRQEKA